MTSFKLICFVIFMLNVLRIHGIISDKRLCANIECSEPISLAKALLKYSSPEAGELSFPANVDITIFSKEAGKNKDLWGAEYNGKRGYVPKRLVREFKILKKSEDVIHLVDTEVPSNILPIVAPNRVQEVYDVVDGTTIFLSPDEATTERPILAASNVPTPTANLLQNEERIENVVDSNAGNKPEKIETDKTVNLETIENIVKPIETIQETIPAIEENKVVEQVVTEGSLIGNIVSSILGNNDAEVKNKMNEEYSDEEFEIDDDEEDDDEFDDESVENDEEVKSSEEQIVDDKSSSEERIKMQELKEQEDIQNLKRKEDLLKLKEEYEKLSATSQEKKVENIEAKKTELKLDGAQINEINELLAETSEKIENSDKPDTTFEKLTNLEQDSLKINEDTINKDNLEHDSSKINEDTINKDFKFSEEAFKINSNHEIPPPPLNVYEDVTPDPLSLNNDPSKPIVGAQVPDISKGFNYFSNRKDLHAETASLDEMKIDDNKQTNTQNTIDEQTIENIQLIEDKPLIEDKSLIEDKQPFIDHQTNENDKIVENKLTSGDFVESLQTNETEKIIDNKPTIEDIVQSLELESKNDVVSNDLPFTGNLHVTENVSLTENIVLNDNLDTNKNLLDTNENVYIENITESINENISSDQNVDSTTENKDKHDSIYNYFDKAEIEKVVENLDMAQDDSAGNKEENVEIKDEQVKTTFEENVPEESSPGLFSSIYGMFDGSSKTDNNALNENKEVINDNVAKIIEIEEKYEETNDDILLSKPNQNQDATCLYDPSQSHCFTEDNPNIAERTEATDTNDQTNQEVASASGELTSIFYMDYINIFELLIVLTVTAITIVVFLWGYMVIDRNRKEAPLVAKINTLQKALLILTKENQILKDKTEEIQNKIYDDVDSISNNAIEQLKYQLEEAQRGRYASEEQVQSLEKELENSTEVGMELNRMLTEVLSSQHGSDTLLANVEQLQTQLVEQQSTINSINTSLNERDLENHELQLELEINNKKVVDLKSELDKMVMSLLKIEEEKEQIQNKNDMESTELRTKLLKSEHLATSERNRLTEEINTLKTSLQETQRNMELKANEYNLLKATMKEVKGSKNSSETIKSLLDVSSIKAELQQLQRDNLLLQDHLKEEQQGKYGFEKQATTALQELQVLKQKYDEADKEKFEALTKLDVLGNYFKEKEAQLQKELSKHENMWVEKQGEAMSTTERIKFMQGELQNFKAQNESLKQEIVSQEVDLKSQISLLEKKAHENWVHARQAERKFEDARQEAAQLRNRLTYRERNLNEEKLQHRIQSPLEHTNGDHHPLTPLHMGENSPISPPLLYGARDHLTTSPPMPGLPPFLPPPPGIPFMPPPLPGVPPFMPPPPSMFPGDHRPPPLGRMSSPPLNSRYSPDSRPYSPYDSRNSPSPTDDDYYGPPHRGYSPYNGRDDRDRRDYNRPPPPRNNFRNHKGGPISSGSADSNESLDRINRRNSKV